MPWGRSKGALDSPSWAVLILPYIEQQNMWNRFTDPNINGTTYPMIARGAQARWSTTHNLIRGQWVATGIMQTPVPVFNCPSRQPRVVREQDGNSVTEGIASDYGVNYGSGTSTAENNNGAFEFSCGNCGTGQRILDLTDGIEQHHPDRREARHPSRARRVRRDDRGGTRLQHLLVAAVRSGRT